MYKILVTETLDEAGISMLREHFEVDVRDATSEEELLELVGQYDALMIKTYTRVSAAVLDRAKQLKIIARAGSGLDRVDLDYAREQGITVVNTPEANITSVAELVFALMLAVARKISVADAYVRAQRGWDRDHFTGIELAGKTLGIVGFGHIGQLVAQRGKAFDMQVCAFDPVIEDTLISRHEVSPVASLETLLSASDFVTLHVPLINSTRHLIGEPEFKIMKTSAVLINTARGGVVDNAALVQALTAGLIAGAGLDVFEQEPPTDADLLALEQLVLTPHVGAATADALRKMSTQAAEKIIKNLLKI